MKEFLKSPEDYEELEDGKKKPDEET